MTKQTLVIALLSALFFVTGADALLVEQTAEKLLSTVVGASTPAGALVLAVYFGGLALGGFLSPAIARKFKSPIAMYATLEGVVGVFALALSSTFPLAQTGLAQMVALGGDHAFAVFALRLVAASLWLLVPTVAMGASYPAVVGALSWLGVERVPLAMTRLYALNLFGSVVSAVVGPYFILPKLGMTGTLLAVAATQTVVVATALLLARAWAPSLRKHDTKPPASPPARISRVLMVAAFVSGAVVFALEVVWVQLIGAVVGMSVYAFAQMLAVVLFGLWLGSAFVSLVAGRRRGALPPWSVPLAFVAAGAVCALTGMFWDHAPLWLLDAAPHVDGFADGERVRLVTIVKLLLPPSAALGVIYPSLFRSGLFEAEDAPAVAGYLGAVNALGSIAGSLLAGFVLIPVAGTEVSYRALSLVVVLTGLGVGLRMRRWSVVQSHPTRIISAVLAAGLLGLAVVSATPRWDPLLITSGIHISFAVDAVHPGDSIELWAEDTAGGIITVVQDKTRTPPVLTLLENGKREGDDGDGMLDAIAVSLVPCALTPSRDRALVVGLGTGAPAEVLASAGFQNLEIAEISEGIALAARTRLAHVNRNVLDDPRVALTIDDGRNHLLRSDRKYDVIATELPSMWFAGAAGLFSRETYELAAKHLTKRGVLAQWVRLDHVAPEEMLSVLATMRSVFPFVNLWRVRGQGLLVASADPIAVDPAALADVKARPDLARDLVLLHNDGQVDITDLGAHVVLDAGGVDRATAYARSRGIPLNTDENRFLETRTPRHNLERVDHQGILLDVLSGFMEP